MEKFTEDERKAIMNVSKILSKKIEEFKLKDESVSLVLSVFADMSGGIKLLPGNDYALSGLYELLDFSKATWFEKQ